MRVPASSSAACDRPPSGRFRASAVSATQIDVFRAFIAHSFAFFGEYAPLVPSAAGKVHAAVDRSVSFSTRRAKQQGPPRVLPDESRPSGKNNHLSEYKKL